MKDMQTPEFPNVVDIIVVVVTCLIALMLAFPLYADAQGFSNTDVSRVEAAEPNSNVKRHVTKVPVLKVANVTELKFEKTEAEETKPEKAKTEQVTVDIDTLKTRLKETDAIGVFTKLAIRSDIVGLVEEINRYRKQSKLELKKAEVRANFDGLLLKIVTLLEGDPVLSRDLYVSRESIWKSLLEVKA